MKTKFAGLSAAALLAASLSTPASAGFINGGITFSDGLTNLSQIVSDLANFDLGAATAASGGTLDFTGIAGPTTVSNINTLAPAGTIYSVGGFSFLLTAVTNLITAPISCAGSQCTDSVEFDIAGTVSSAGFDDTAFLGNFTANGDCIEDRNAPGACSPGSQNGSWTSTVIAGAPAQTPVPATLGLLGLALAGLGWIRRSKA